MMSVICILCVLVLILLCACLLRDTGYLKQTSDGLMALVVDWYSLSLANVLFALRRNTGITSTFVKVMSCDMEHGAYACTTVLVR